MQWDTISDQWLWITAAVVFAGFVGAFVLYSFKKPKKTQEATKPYDAIQNQQDAWIPTGRVDFFDPQ